MRNGKNIDILSDMALSILRKRNLSEHQLAMARALKEGARALLSEDIREEITNGSSKESKAES